MAIQFCSDCSNVLDYPGDQDSIKCSFCGLLQSAKVFEEGVIVTKSLPEIFPYRSKLKEVEDEGEGQGATIKEKCPSCGNPEMKFHTMQLRSADEGQTVFYTCPKCAYKYSLRS